MCFDDCHFHYALWFRRDYSGIRTTLSRVLRQHLGKRFPGVEGKRSSAGARRYISRCIGECRIELRGQLLGIFSEPQSIFPVCRVFCSTTCCGWTKCNSGRRERGNRDDHLTGFMVPGTRLFLCLEIAPLSRCRLLPIESMISQAARRPLTFSLPATPLSEGETRSGGLLLALPPEPLRTGGGGGCGGDGDGGGGGEWFSLSYFPPTRYDKLCLLVLNTSFFLAFSV